MNIQSVKKHALQVPDKESRSRSQFGISRSKSGGKTKLKVKRQKVKSMFSRGPCGHGRKIDRIIHPYLKKQSQFQLDRNWRKLFYDK